MRDSQNPLHSIDPLPLMARKGASRNRGAGKAAAGQSKGGEKPGMRGPFTLRNFAIAGLAVVCGLFILRRPRANDSPDRAELGSRRLAVRIST